jgi:hypothetical protein
MLAFFTSFTPKSANRILPLIARFLPYLGRVRWTAAQVAAITLLAPLIA